MATTDEEYVRRLTNTAVNGTERYLALEGMNPRNFFAELKRRHVYRVAIAYAVVAWLLIQIATQVFPFFEIPNWAVRLVVLVVVLGFPIALIIAWAFEMTPQGIKRAENISPTEYIPHCDYCNIHNGSADVSTCARQITFPRAHYRRCKALSKIDRGPASA